VIDDIEPQLRESLRRAVLPDAPTTLREYLARLPMVDNQPPLRVRRYRAPLFVAAAVALLVVAVGAAMMLTGATGLRNSTAVPSLGTGPLPSTAASPASAGPRTFGAPGISFDFPVGWSDQTSAVEYPTVAGMRFVGLLARGMTFCPTRYYSTAPPTPRPTGCETSADQPGSATLVVLELTHQFSWTHGSGTPTTFAGYRVWEPTVPASTQAEWTIQSPDSGLYLITLTAPVADIAADMTEVRSMFESLRLSTWEAAPQVVNGHIHVDPQRGFSFDYPAGWTLYYPQDLSTMDSAVVTVASAPLLPPCSSGSCQRFTTPPAAIAIEFRVGNGPTAPDWSKAPTTIGGQPAFGPENWGPQNATGADEGHTWSVRLTDQSTLGIMVSLRGPDLPGLRAAMDEVLGSVRISQLMSPAR
jgi:hypothetical protein